MSLYQMRAIEERIAELEAENKTFRASQKACEDCAPDLFEPLKARIAELESALRAAAASLNTIADQAGRDEYMRDWLEVRGYAANRCAAARAALAPKESSE